MRARRALAVALVAFVALGGGAVGARAWVLDRAEAKLRGHGLAWARRVDSWKGARWEGLRGTGLSIGAASVQWAPRPAVEIADVDVDMEARAGAAGGGVGEGSGLPLWVAVALTNGTLRWGEEPIAGPLSGTLAPEVDLAGPDAALTREDGVWVARLHRVIDRPELRGAAELVLRLGSPRSATLDMPDAVLASPMLSEHPLPAQPLHVEGTWAEGGAVEGTARFGGVSAHATGTLGMHPLAVALHVTLGPAPLETVVDLFGPLVPEAKRATLSGELGLLATISGPPLAWHVEPKATGLAATGVIPNPTELASGPFSYRVTLPSGETRVRESGEGTPDWVEPEATAREGLAVIASEDADFWNHPGYDLPAIQEALDAWAGGEARPRGGSTLSQQLAKNLFLDGDRTLVRKLRELLYALDLEQTLGKRRILELYLNVVQFGPEVWGVGPASDTYFLKKPEGLTWREAAFLA